MKEDFSEQQNHKTIVLLGMMGVGKSSIGAKLAEKLGIYFIDSDQEIEDNQGKSIADIFTQNGEEYFRNIEEKTIKAIINRDEAMVVALGGGSFMNPQIRNLVKEKTISIWLYSDLEVILHRLTGKVNRPLLNSADKRKTLENLIKIRYPIYEQADFKIDSSKENRDLTVENIIKQIQDFTIKNGQGNS